MAQWVRHHWPPAYVRITEGEFLSSTKLQQGNCQIQLETDVDRIIPDEWNHTSRISEKMQLLKSKYSYIIRFYCLA